MKLRELGDALGVTAQQLHKHETRGSLSFWRAAQICRVLDVPLSDLLPNELRAQLIPQLANAAASPLDAGAVELASRPNRTRPQHSARAARTAPQ